MHKEVRDKKIEEDREDNKEEPTASVSEEAKGLALNFDHQLLN